MTKSIVTLSMPFVICISRRRVFETELSCEMGDESRSQSGGIVKREISEELKEVSARLRLLGELSLGFSETFISQ